MDYLLALAGDGFDRIAALQAIAAFWRPVPMRDDFNIQELRRFNVATFYELSFFGLLAEQAEDLYEHIGANRSFLFTTCH